MQETYANAKQLTLSVKTATFIKIKITISIATKYNKL